MGDECLFIGAEDRGRRRVFPRCGRNAGKP